jgi:hypothetical protein
MGLKEFLINNPEVAMLIYAFIGYLVFRVIELGIRKIFKYFKKGYSPQERIVNCTGQRPSFLPEEKVSSEHLSSTKPSFDVEPQVPVDTKNKWKKNEEDYLEYGG